jgi:hypothetical protein
MLPALHRHLAPQSCKANRPAVSSWAEVAALDNLLCDFHRSVPVYAAYPFLAWQAPGNSTIDSKLQAAWSADGKQLWCPEVAAELDRRIAEKFGTNQPPIQTEAAALAKSAGAKVKVSGATIGESPKPLFRGVPRFIRTDLQLQELPKFCINLARRPDRKIRAWSQFRKQGLEVSRIAAPDAAGITEQRSWECVGYRACASGHRLAWRAARKLGAPAAVVFEDDVVLCRDFSERLQNLHLPDDWGVFFFGCCFEPPGPELLPNGLLRVRCGTFDNHAYAIRKELWSELAPVFQKLNCRGRKAKLPVGAVNRVSESSYVSR